MIKIGDEEIFYTDTGGDKPALLFVHGIAMDHSVWKHQIEAFRTDYRVVSVDLRGYGQSTAASPDITFEQHAADLAALIDALDLKNVVLVGWSLGGAIAQVFAASHGSKISRLVLVATTPQLLADDKFGDALPVAAAKQLRAMAMVDYTKAMAAYSGMVAPEDPRVAAMLTEITETSRPDVVLTAFKTSGERSQLDLLARIEVPTAVIAGREDALCFPAASTYLAKHIAGSMGAATFIDAGHAPFLTSPDAFNAALRAALS